MLRRSCRSTDAAVRFPRQPRRPGRRYRHVFQTVQQQTGCSFVYNTSDIDTDRKVTVSAQDEPLTALLDKLFAGSDIAYTLRDKHIVLSKKTKNSPPPTTLRAESAEPLRTLRACR